MSIIYLILLSGSILVTIFLLGIGAMGLVQKRVWWYDKHVSTMLEITGKDSTKYCLYYIFAGLLWGIATYLRITE